jgi:hypothetical protein
MQKTTKTSKQTASKAAATVQAGKSAAPKTTKSKATTNTSWLTSNTSRPKTLIVQMQRTASGYTIKEATVLSPINQHASKQVPVSVRAVTEDINRRGITI